MTNEFAAYHEAGHAVATTLLGGKVESMGLKPTPHCIPDVCDMKDEDVATVCMAGGAATMIKFNQLGPIFTDERAAKIYGSSTKALGDAMFLLRDNWDKVISVAEDLLGQIPPEDRMKKSKICVDTVKRVVQNGPSVDTPVI